MSTVSPCGHWTAAAIVRGELPSGLPTRRRCGSLTVTLLKMRLRDLAKHLDGIRLQYEVADGERAGRGAVVRAHVSSHDEHRQVRTHLEQRARDIESGHARHVE